MSYAPRGAPVGFRRDDGQLIALAGATTQPLTDAHYTWQTLAGVTQHMDQAEGPVAEDANASDDSESPIVQWIFDTLGDAISDWLDGDDDGGGYDHHSGKGHEHHSHEHSPKSHSSNEPKKKPSSQPSS
jgi:hypothetical protein